MCAWYHAVCVVVVQEMRVYTCVCMVPCCVCCCCAGNEGVHVCVHVCIAVHVVGARSFLVPLTSALCCPLPHAEGTHSLPGHAGEQPTSDPPKGAQ